jgi:peptidoglycan hydrolase CwlO-like protein
VSAQAVALSIVSSQVSSIFAEVTLILPAIGVVESVVAVNKTLLYTLSGEVAYNDYLLNGKIQANHTITLRKIASSSTQVDKNKRLFLQRFQNIQDTTQEVKKKVDDVDENVKEIKKDFKELDKKLKSIEESIKKLPEETSHQVSFKVVGESYFRYDSTSSFYPTLFFRYKEDIEGPRARVSQIKINSIRKDRILPS